MTLRARLAIAFFSLILGPALLGAAFVLGLMIAAGPAPGPDRVAQSAPAVEAVRASIRATCMALEVTASALARRASMLGESLAVTPEGEFGLWAICDAGVSPVPLPAGSRYGALAGRAEIRGVDGSLAGYAYALQPLDDRFLRQLSMVAGSAVTLRPVGETTSDVLAPTVEQPLWLAFVAEQRRTGQPRELTLVTVLTAVGASCLLGWWLAGLATRPLSIVLATVERVATGDFTARSMVGGRDEAGRLGSELDRLIAGMEENQRLSRTDALTGLGNLRQLRESLRIEVERAARFGRALGVLMIDLDHFKTVNDNYGHRAGDAVLVEFAQRVRGVIREVDLAFRQGGEEFVILLPETEVAGSLTAARRIGDAVRTTPFLVSVPPGARATGTVQAISVTVSIGIAVFPRHAISGAGVLDAADDALYAAKAAGRDTFVLATASVPHQWLGSSPQSVTPTSTSGSVLLPPGEGGGASSQTTPTRPRPDG